MQLSAFRDLKSWWNQVSHSDDSIWILGISLVWPIISSLQEDEENPTVFTISLELSDRDMSVSLRVNPVCKLRKAPQEAWLTWSCIKEVGGTYCSFSEVNFSFPEFPPLGRCSRAVQEVSAGAASLSELCLLFLFFWMVARAKYNFLALWGFLMLSLKLPSWPCGQSSPCVCSLWWLNFYVLVHYLGWIDICSCSPRTRLTQYLILYLPGFWLQMWYSAQFI